MVDKVAGITNDAPSPSNPRSKISSVADVAVVATADPTPKMTRPTIRARRRPNLSPMAPDNSRNEANISEYASITHSSWVWLAPVPRAMEGRATFSDAIAETTAAKAIQTTAVTRPWLTDPR